MQPKSNWKTVSLKDLCSTLQSGGTPPRSNPHNFHGPYKWASVADLTKSNKFIFDTAGSLSEKGLNESTAMLFPANTILFAMYASIGECAIASDAMACSQAILGIQPNDKCNTDFLYYFLQSYKQKAKSLGQQGTQSNLNKKIVGDINVVLPPLVEQQKIASVLSDLDALIEAQEALIAKKKDVKAATMELLLTGKKRLPGFNTKNEYKKTKYGHIPKEWSVIPMGDVSACFTGLTYSPQDTRDQGILVLRSSNIQKGKLAFKDNVFVDMMVPDRAITKTNDILICVRNGSRDLIGKCALVDDKTAGSAFGAFMSILRSDSASFLFFAFQSDVVKKQIEKVMGATINQITNRDLATFSVIWPAQLEERIAISDFISNIEKEIFLMEHELEKMQLQKSAAMHKLLTGEIRLA